LATRSSRMRLTARSAYGLGKFSSSAGLGMREQCRRAGGGEGLHGRPRAAYLAACAPNPRRRRPRLSARATRSTCARWSWRGGAPCRPRRRSP
jgi:hypothetical protein